MVVEVRKKTFDLDASNWKTRGDVYDAILKILGVPASHSRSVDALLETMVWNDIKAVEPPYIIRVHDTLTMSADPTEELSWIMEGLDEARAYLKKRRRDDVDVAIRIVD